MNYKTRKPRKKKYRYFRRGWGGESEKSHRDAVLKEFIENKIAIIREQNSDIA